MLSWLVAICLLLFEWIIITSIHYFTVPMELHGEYAIVDCASTFGYPYTSHGSKRLNLEASISARLQITFAFKFSLKSSGSFTFKVKYFNRVRWIVCMWLSCKHAAFYISDLLPWNNHNYGQEQLDMIIKAILLHHNIIR